MWRKSTVNFYLKNALWIFFCLGVAGICQLITNEITNIQRRYNENRAAWSVVDVRRLQNEYSAKHRGKYAPNFDELVKTGFLAEKFRGPNPVVNGYTFEMKVEEPTGQYPPFFSITADPVESEGDDKTGALHFYTDSTLGTTRGTTENRPATAADPTI